MSFNSPFDSHPDICYDEDFAKLALNWLRVQVALGTDVYIGDPGRAYLPLTGPYIEYVYSYKLPESVEEQNHGLVNGSIYKLRT